MPQVRVEFGVINITADPHDDPNVYASLLTKVAYRPAQFHGELHGAITAPEQWEPGLLLGTIQVWTEFDPDKPAVNKDLLKEVRVEDTKINVPPNFGLNGEHFFYVLRPRDHKIFYERRNDEGQTLAPKRFRKMLDHLFAPINLGGETAVSVTVVPDEDGLDKVLSIPRITNLDILITPPNPDGNERHAARVLKRLKDRGAKSQEEIWHAKSRKKGLTLDDEMKADAEVAANNGVVTASGYDLRGRPIAPRSTDEYPKIIPFIVEGAGSALAGLIRIARTTVIRDRKRTKDE